MNEQVQSESKKNFLMEDFLLLNLLEQIILEEKIPLIQYYQKQ